MIQQLRVHEIVEHNRAERIEVERVVRERHGDLVGRVLVPLRHSPAAVVVGA